MNANKVGGILFSLFVLFLVVMAPQANAFSLAISAASNPEPNIGETVTFTAEVAVETDEQVPIDALSLFLSDGTECVFDINGAPITGCEGIDITLVQNTLAETFGNNTFEFENDTYNFGYGYGFSGPGGGVLEYAFSLNTSEFGLGVLRYRLDALVDVELFSSDEQSIHIRQPDTVPPVITTTEPHGNLAANSTQVVLSANTQEDSVCRYDTEDVAYEAMDFTMTGTEREHTATTTVAAGGKYKFFVRCQDESGNVNHNSKLIVFSVQKTK